MTILRVEVVIGLEIPLKTSQYPVTILYSNHESATDTRAPLIGYRPVNRMSWLGSRQIQGGGTIKLLAERKAVAGD